MPIGYTKEFSNANISKQCDLTRPSCIRCTRRQVSCPGYRNELDVIFWNENPSTLTAKASRGRRNESVSDMGVSLALSAEVQPQREITSRSRLASCSAVTVPRPLTYGSTTEVEELPLTLDQWSFSPGWQRHDSSTSFLTRIVEQSAENTALIYCCRAAARAYFNNRLRTTENRLKQLAAYGKALVATNTVLQDREVCSRDDTALASVWLLGQHEVSSKDSPRDGLC